MSSEWANRQRETNHLTRLIAAHILNKRNIKPTQIAGLAKLSWITNGSDSYIKTTKIPALQQALDIDDLGTDLSEIATHVSSLISTPSVKKLIKNHTGFTNFYKVYRNSVDEWVSENFEVLLHLFRKALVAKSKADRLKLVRTIENLPNIPSPSGNISMHAEFFLTPALFSLDPQIRFPIINGNKNVKALQRRLNITGTSLENQFAAMVSLYGKGGIEDAADLDQVGENLPDFILALNNTTRKGLLKKKKATSNAKLSVKDDGDIECLKKALTVTQKRKHNSMTNQLTELLSEYTLTEGHGSSAMYDVLVEKYDGNHNLLIEVKSSAETAHIRMAIGQLYDYCYQIDEDPNHLAILLPEKPDDIVLDMLKWLYIGSLWFENECLKTNDKWLKHLTD